MSTPAPSPSPDPDPRTTDAARVLASRADRRWVEVATDVLAVLMTTTRRSLPVLLDELPDGSLSYLSDQVLVGAVHRAVDEVTPRAATSAVHLSVSPRHLLERVTVELVVQYGTPLLPVADRVRGVVQDRLRTLAPGSGDALVVVEPTHVHVADVVTGDPHESDV